MLTFGLAVASDAFAHVTVTPARVEPGEDVLLTFAVPNEQEVGAVDEVRIRLPSEVEAVQAKAGWRAGREGRTLVWRGGPIAPGEFETFAVALAAPFSLGEVVFPVEERFASGGVERYRPRVRVEEAAAPARDGRDSGARTLGKAALFVAVAAGAVAVGAGFLALGGWLRRD